MIAQDIRKYILDLGLAEEHVVRGGMKVRDLEAIWGKLKTVEMPLRMLHIGNFVGFSLCYFAKKLKELNGNTLILSIDPDLPYRGIKKPADIVTQVLHHFGVDDMVLRLTGYSLDKNISNDGNNFTGDYDPQEHFEAELSAEWQLANLLKLGKSWLGSVLIDGNHEGPYLEREIAISYELLKDGGHLYIDDVYECFPEVQEVYEKLSDGSLFATSKIGGRIGFMVKQPQMEAQKCII